MKLLKSIAAILAGMLFIIALSIGTDAILEKLNVFTSPNQGSFINWMLLLALAYRCLYAIGGGFITATLAPKKRMRHVMILGYIGLTVSIIGVITSWDRPDHWYPIALAITALPTVWLGGVLKKKLKTMGRQ
jgi:hypothetical protein